MKQKTSKILHTQLIKIRTLLVDFFVVDKYTLYNITYITYVGRYNTHTLYVCVCVNMYGAFPGTC